MDTKTQQLKKQQQELVNSLTQIINDSNIPINEKLQVIKELSRTLANIAEQINKMTGSTPVQTEVAKEKIAEQRKEEIKQIKKEIQPPTIPEKVETAKWKMEDIIKVIKLNLDTIQYRSSIEDLYIDWDMFEAQAIPKLMEQIRELFPKTN